jgi:hypothetical protein
MSNKPLTSVAEVKGGDNSHVPAYSDDEFILGVREVRQQEICIG